MPEESPKERVKRIGKQVVNGLRTLKQDVNVPIDEEAINQFEREIESEELNVFTESGRNISENMGTEVKGLFTRRGGEDIIQLPDLQETNDLTIMHEMVHAVRQKEKDLDPFREELPEEIDESATNWLATHIAVVNGYNPEHVKKFEKEQVYPGRTLSNIMEGYEGKLKKEISKRTLRNMQEARKIVKKRYKTLSDNFLRKSMTSIAKYYRPERTPYYFDDVSEEIAGVLRGDLDFEEQDFEELEGRLEAIHKMNEHVLENENRDVRLSGLKTLLDAHEELRGLNEEQREEKLNDLNLEENIQEDIKEAMGEGFNPKKVMEFKNRRVNEIGIGPEEVNILKKWEQEQEHFQDKGLEAAEDILERAKPEVQEDTGENLLKTYEENRGPLPGNDALEVLKDIGEEVGIESKDWTGEEGEKHWEPPELGERPETGPEEAVEEAEPEFTKETEDEEDEY